MEKARACKEKKVFEKEKETEKAMADRSEAIVAAVRASHPVVARSLGIGGQKAIVGMDHAKAQAWQQSAL